MIAGSTLENFHFQSGSIQQLIDFLCKSTNIKLECYKDGFLRRRIKFRMNRLNIKSDKEYLEYLWKNPSEFNEFRNQFTVNYTYYFRNHDVFELLMWYFLNGKLMRKREDVLKIWSAPCSTGEEPYSLALLFDFMKKNNKKYPNLEVEIVASDIDGNAIDRAKKGIYNSYSLHELPPFYASYFTRDDNDYEPRYILSEKIKEQVKFIQEDLTEGHGLNQKYDIIFCRNLLIYLNNGSQKKVLKTISEHLNIGGLLVLGKTELINESKSSDFQLINPRVHFYSHLR